MGSHLSCPFKFSKNRYPHQLIIFVFKFGHKEQFKKTSPALNAEKIKTPLFIVQGANDPRVKKSESDQMVKALKKNGVEVEYMVKDNEGHGFQNEENQFDFYRATETFLLTHIGG